MNAEKVSLRFQEMWMILRDQRPTPSYVHNNFWTYALCWLLYFVCKQILTVFMADITNITVTTMLYVIVTSFDSEIIFNNTTTNSRKLWRTKGSSCYEIILNVPINHDPQCSYVPGSGYSETKLTWGFREWSWDLHMAELLNFKCKHFWKPVTFSKELKKICMLRRWVIYLLINTH